MNMKIFKKVLFTVSGIILLMISSSYNQKEIVTEAIEYIAEQYPIEIDVQKKYKKRILKLQEIAEVTYIPLETTKDVLLSNVLNGLNISDNLIVTMNQSGTIFCFNHNGHHISQFNHRGRGPKEYQDALKLAVDFDENTIYIYDYQLLYRIQIYSLSGDFKKSISIPNGLWINDIQNYDKDYLLVYMTPSLWENNKGTFRPYYLMSKKDGSLKQISLDVPELKDDNIRRRSPDGRARMIGYQTSPIIHNGTEFFLSDFSKDVIYRLNGTNLTPYIHIKPSVQKSIPPLYVSISLETTKYTFISIIEKDEKAMEVKQHFIAIDHRTGEIFEPDFGNDIFSKAPNNYLRNLPKDYSVITLSAENIVDAYKRGELDGALQKTASKLKMDDNPVLMLLKFQ